MANVVNKKNRDKYLRTKDRFYVAGWVDGENDCKSQVSEASIAISEVFGEAEKSYLDGYMNAKDNQFTQDGRV